ncbi:MAG TPA: GGDEF domain-containing protein [Terracidiphilus sp.]|nr:GGDEF domain-containing protein [Terracidiphilus sp.]
MRPWILAIALSVAWASAPAETPTLATLQAIHTLSTARAATGLPVAFEATVTYYSKSDVDLFVQDGDLAVYVETTQNQNLLPGDRVLVRGKTRGSFKPDVVAESVTVLRHGPILTPVKASFQQLIRAERDCMLVSVHATVRSADIVNFINLHGIYLKLLLDGGAIDATVNGTDISTFKDLLDSEVEVTGVASGKFDNKMQLIGIVLQVPSLSYVKIVRHAHATPDTLPITPMDQVMSSYYAHDLSQRVRVQGTITYYQPGSAVVLQNADKSLWISTHASNPMRIGDVAVATGFPDARGGFLSLTDAEIADTDVFEPAQPQAATWRQLASWNSGDPDGHLNDLVSFEGDVVDSVREDAQDVFVLRSDGKLFSAIYRHPSNSSAPPLPRLLQGTRIRVSGICTVVEGDFIDPTQQEVPFEILLRSYDDIAIVSAPPMVSVQNLIILVGLLVALLLAAGVRSWLTERKVRVQNARSAYLERRRSRILEDINGTRPLPEIIEQITELVSFKLRGAPCWCKITDGAQLGNTPPTLGAFRIVEEPIHARSGPPLGTIYSAFDPLTKPQADEPETLTMAAALVTLAIETRRLYSDLVHRSDFDLLTDIHNRFSLDRYLDQQIELARETATIVGLIYVDLNDFKQVNDVYGHHIGDLYLQEVAARMKHHLRAADMLARLGGDEFAVLLPKVRNRAEVEEVARRLERSLEDPFTADGYTIQGSASVGIALYPEDGETRDSILSAADAAMYVNKHIRRENRSSRGRNQL